ncbi:MAG: acetyl-CoA acyltransferase [Parcubacteria group bacterium Gr01-1014_19]|nr:MAG: acetyl-CoA acyltransferase [Parcubacteria group bacterium Gr01-1014_19]
MNTAVIVDGLRTPFVKAGAVGAEPAGYLALGPVMALLARYPDLRNKIDCVIGANIGNQALPPDGSNLARLIALQAGIPETVPAWTVNINCASGLHAVLDAIKHVELGQFKCVLVVAAESMSDYTAVYSREQRQKFSNILTASKKKSLWKKIPSQLWALAKTKIMPHDPQWMLKLGLTDPFCGLGMDKISDQLAKDWKISRTELDLYAQESHTRASDAQAAGKFDEEIAVPEGWDKNDFRDNGIRQGQTLEQLAKLRPLNPGGVTTAGNSSIVSDGAVALIIADLEFVMAKDQDWPVLAMMDSTKSAVAGCTPSKMGLGPVNAIAKLCQKNGWGLNQFDLIETNEAFASVVLAQSKAMASPEYCATLGLAKPLGPLPWNKTNVNGGAIAIGHPISASGARLVLTCAKEMNRREGGFSLVTLCVGGGQGEAAVIESPGF